MRAPLALVAALALVPGLAAADDAPVPPIQPDPRAIEEAREANLVPESVREGFAIGIAVGPAVQLGYGISDATGGGGAFNLRLGAVATPSWILLFEISTTAYDANGDVNQSAVATFGGQYYVNGAFWVRGGAGFATFTRSVDDNETGRFNGLGVLGAGGFDLVRRKGVAVSLEGMSSLARYRKQGTVMGAGLLLGVSWY